ncbi:hypothetical protein FO519_000983 [Halicephalobus sp. NKZ332]|nr:hypothetical protein FO519_000983 [Halicephalobus sp. NKZ332]
MSTGKKENPDSKENPRQSHPLFTNSILDTLLEHNCGKKIGGLSEYSNWQRIVFHGYKSKAKDALAVLETVPFPQKARIPRIQAKKHEEAVDGPVAPIFNPKSLVDCAYAVLETTQFCHSPDEVEVEGPYKAIEREILVEDDLYSGPRRVGYYCQKCRRIFRPFYAYTNHLVEGSICATLPDPEQVDITSLFPLNGKVIEPKISEPPKHKMMCTRCKQSDFESREKFHEHLFECARNPEFDTDEDPVPTDTFSESSST